jgi:hypothetical protein
LGIGLKKSVKNYPVISPFPLFFYGKRPGIGFKESKRKVENPE